MRDNHAEAVADEGDGAEKCVACQHALSAAGSMRRSLGARGSSICDAGIVIV